MTETMKTILLTLLSTLLLLTACTDNKQLADGYQPGDGIAIAADTAGKIVAAVQMYCDTARDSAVRAGALAVIRRKYPLVPEDGICIGP